MRSTCRRCGGSGSVIKNPCRKCNGAGSLMETRKVTVPVPAGKALLSVFCFCTSRCTGNITHSDTHETVLPEERLNSQ